MPCPEEAVYGNTASRSAFAIWLVAEHLLENYAGKPLHIHKTYVQKTIWV